MMPEKTMTAEDLMEKVHQLSAAELERLMGLLYEEQWRRKVAEHSDNPLLGLVGAWADMGDEGIAEFEAEIAAYRKQPAREVVIDWDEDDV